MSERSVYKSSTGVEVPLSFTGKHLLQSLREAIQDALVKRYNEGLADGRHHAREFTAPGRAWEPISKARLAIAQHMSKLEGRTEELKLSRNQMYGRSLSLDSNPLGQDKWMHALEREVDDFVRGIRSEQLKNELVRRGEYPSSGVEKLTTDELLKELQKRLTKVFELPLIKYMPILDTRTQPLCATPKRKKAKSKKRATGRAK